MKRVLCLAFLLMGFTFTVTQGLLVRELLVAFFGNELSIGLILGSWLILEAAGSGLLGRLARRWNGKASSFAALQVLLAVFLPICLYATYVSRRFIGAIPGEGVGLIPIFAASFFILTPLALVDGAMFAFGCRAYAALASDKASSVGRVYVYEALGAIVGGIVFTYLFIPFLYSLQIVLLLVGLNLLSATLILVSPHSAGRRRVRLTSGLTVVLVLLAVDLGCLLSPLPEQAQRWGTAQQWPGYHLVYSENSPYGNVAVVQREAQYTFYADGIPALTAPVPDVVLSEEIVHLPLLFVPQPRRALVLSGGVGGVLHELTKYPLQRIDYAELDPLLIDAVREFPTPLTRGELSDPRVKVELIDGRLLATRKLWEAGSHSRGEKERYDLVIVNLPYPSTLQLNRFYTVEFFHTVRELLSEGGVLVIGCPGSLTYISDELRDLNTMVYRTLRQAFPHVRPIPGDITLWLASPSDALSAVAMEDLVERWEWRSLETRLLTASHIHLRLGQSRLDWFWGSLGGESSEARASAVGRHVNRDLYPVGVFYALSYWNALFSPHLSRFFTFIRRLHLWTLSSYVVGCAALFLVFTKLTARGRGAGVPIAIVTTGFTGMAADLVVVFAFQTLYGYVYHWIALLITAFMAGLSLGGLLMTRRLAASPVLPPAREGLPVLPPARGGDRGGERRALLRLELVIVLYWVLLPVALSALYTHLAHALAVSVMQGLLLVLNGVAGFLVGSQFPLANRMWLQGKKGLRDGGVLYACDLLGAFLGSVVVSVVLIPVLGILGTCLLAGVLKLASFLLVAALPSPS